MPSPIWNQTPIGTAGGTARWRTVYKYRDSYAPNAALVQVWIEAAFNDTPGLRRALLGYATWDGTSKYLNRQVPLAAPYTGGALVGAGDEVNPPRLQRLDLDLFYPDQPDSDHVYAELDDATGYHWLGVDGYVHYQCSFGNLPYRVLTDDAANVTAYDGTPGLIPPESVRFCKVTRRYMPEARKTPSAGFQCYDPAKSFESFVVQEVGFIPTFQVEIVAELIEWPFEAYPDAGIAACVGTVNDATMFLAGKSYGPGQLLYKGPAREVEPSYNAAGYEVVNVPHVFGWRPQGWNTHRLNDGRWMPVVVKGTQPTDDPSPGTGALTPMFALADHRTLFEPG